MNEQEQKTPPSQLAVSPPANGQSLAPWDSTDCLFSTFGNATAEAKLRTLRVINGDSFDSDAARGQMLQIRHVVMHSVPMEDEATGEMVAKLRTCLVTLDDMVFACVSEGVISSLKQICSLYGKPPWDPALKCELVERRTRKGYRVLKLIPVGD